MRSEKQHVPVDQYLDNLRSIMQHVRRVGANATVIITPPPVYEPDRLVDRQRKHGVSERTAQAERTNQMTGAAPSLVERLPLCRASAGSTLATDEVSGDSRRRSPQ